MTVTPAESVDAANHVFRSHRGFRALHAKGTLCTARFTAGPEAGRLTRAAHMQGEPVAATVRVSNASGDPREPDYRPDVRGLAVKFYLPDGSRTDLVCQSIPRFPVRTPDEFVELLLAGKLDPAIVWKLPMFLARHPKVVGKLPAGLPALRPIASYATCTYYATHAFEFTDKDGGSRHVRYTLVPEAGDRRISLPEARRQGRDYLQEEIRQRLADGPVRFTLQLQLAAPGDNIDDPSSVWPSDRERVTAGRLELTGLDTERETGGDVLVFDPTRVTDGIGLSDDPVLRFRHRAYSESVERRSGRSPGPDARTPAEDGV